MSKIDTDSLITEFIDNVDFDVLIAWADLMEVDHDESSWLDDMWPEMESDLRSEVAGEMILVGVK